MDQTARKNRLVLAISQWRTKKESPTSRVFPNWRCGPILTRIGAYENQYLKLFDVGVTFFFWVVSGFLFSVRKQKTEMFSKFQIGPKNATPPPERAEKTSTVIRGTFLGRPNLELEKTRAFHVKICLYFPPRLLTSRNREETELSSVGGASSARIFLDSKF